LLLISKGGKRFRSAGIKSRHFARRLEGEWGGEGGRRGLGRGWEGGREGRNRFLRRGLEGGR